VEYEAVLKVVDKSHLLAAEAHYRLAKCYLTISEEEKMAAQIERLRRDFPASNRWVIRANPLVSAVNEFSGAPWQDGRLHT